MTIEELIELGKKYYPYDESNNRHNTNLVLFHKRVLDSTSQETKEKCKNLGITDCEFYSYLMLVGFGAKYIQMPLLEEILPDEFIKEIIANLDSFLLKVKNTESEILYRQDNYSNIDSFSEGGIISFENYLVTSIDDFDNSYNIIWVITPIMKKSKGHEGYRIYERGNKEKQVTFERKSTFIINKIEKKNDKNYIHCIEV